MNRRPGAAARHEVRTGRLAAALAALILLGLGAARTARAEWVPQYYLFDRVVWSPDSRSVGLVGRYRNAKPREALDDTLVVDVASGAVACVSPSMNSFVLSRDGRRVLGLGRWGIYDHDLDTGVTRQVWTFDPFLPAEIAAFSYSRDGNAAVCIRCSDNDPGISGVYSFPLDGGPPTRLLADPRCAEQSLNFWQVHRREIAVTPENIPGGGDPTVIDNFPGTVWQVKKAEKGGVAVWGNGPAASDTLCFDCRTSFVSWPPAGGRALVSTVAPDIWDVTTPGDLWLLHPSEHPHRLARGHFRLAAWPDSSHALVISRPGCLFAVDAVGGTIRQVDLSLVPPWLRNAHPAAPQIWTIRLDREVYAGPDSARAAAMALRDVAGLGYAVDPVGGGPQVSLCAGAFPDSARAVAAARQLAGRRGLSGREFSARIEHRPVAEMRGQFDFGSVLSPDGKWRLFFRSHPHMFRPCVASEVWLEPVGGGPRRQILRAMANF
jgi:hypothetical protein